MNARIKLGAILFALLIVAAACQQAMVGPEAVTAPAMERANAARTGVYDTAGVEKFNEVKWQFKAGDWVFGAPVVSDGLVYVTSYDKNLYALDQETGAETWRFATGDSILAAPAAAGGLVFVGSMDGNIYALDGKTGAEKWRVAVEGGFTGSPVVAGDLVYFASENGTLRALGLQDGKEAWLYEGEDLVIGFNPAVSDGSVYFLTNDGVLRVLDAATGAEQWTYDPAAGLPDQTYTPTGGVAVADGAVYLLMSNLEMTGVLQAVDIASQKLRWEFAAGGENFTAPAISGELVYFGSLDGKLYAIETATGLQRWTYPTEGIIFASPAVAGDYVYFGSGDTNFYVANAVTGRPVWQFRAAAGVSSPALHEGVVYFGDETGAVYALR